MSFLTKPTLLTQEGLEKLTEELETLTTEKREEIAVRLASALADGKDDDFVENAELEAARNEHSYIEARISEIEDMLRNYELIERAPKGSRKVIVGSFVTVSEEGFDEKERYQLVGPAEANPAEGKISYESLLGEALIDSKKGDSVSFDAPGGTITFTVVKVG